MPPKTSHEGNYANSHQICTPSDSRGSPGLACPTTGADTQLLCGLDAPAGPCGRMHLDSSSAAPLRTASIAFAIREMRRALSSRFRRACDRCPWLLMSSRTCFIFPPPAGCLCRRNRTSYCDGGLRLCCCQQRAQRQERTGAHDLHRSEPRTRSFEQRHPQRYSEDNTSRPDNLVCAARVPRRSRNLQLTPGLRVERIADRDSQRIGIPCAGCSIPMLTCSCSTACTTTTATEPSSRRPGRPPRARSRR